MTLKSTREIAFMMRAGEVVAKTLSLLERMIGVGVETRQLDMEADAFIRGFGGIPSFKGYRGFPASVCISINEEIVHGIPSKRRIQDGDVVSVDVGVQLDGYHADAARTFPVGNVNPETLRLIAVTEQCFFEGLRYARSGGRVGDISRAVQQHAESAGFSVVRELVGHGIGQRLHEAPDVPNFVQKSRGERLQKGMTLAIEPMINQGKQATRVCEDGWTVVTLDRLPSAHYENTIVITDEEPAIMTLNR